VVVYQRYPNVQTKAVEEDQLGVLPKSLQNLQLVRKLYCALTPKPSCSTRCVVPAVEGFDYTSASSCFLPDLYTRLSQNYAHEGTSWINVAGISPLIPCCEIYIICNELLACTDSDKKKGMSRDADFEWLDVCGRGAYGEVHRVKDKRSQEIVAIKTIPRTAVDRFVIEEVQNLSKCHHPQIIQFREVIITIPATRNETHHFAPHDLPPSSCTLCGLKGTTFQAIPLQTLYCLL